MDFEIEGKYEGKSFGKLLSAEGLTANIYISGPSAFKVFNKDYPVEDVFKEAYSLTCVKSAGIKVPAVNSVFFKEGHWAVEMEYISGPVMIDELIKAVESGDNIKASGYLEELVFLQHELAQKKALSLPDYKNYLYGQLESKGPFSKEQRSFLLSRLDALPSGHGIIHGDFQPFNIIHNEKGTYIIDWEPGGAGCEECSAARTYLNFTCPPIKSLRNWNLSGRYLEFCKKISDISYDDILPWLPVQAALCLIVSRDENFKKNITEYIPE